MSGRLRPSLVMLDCDGTLFDSFEANRGFYDAILERMGRSPLDPAQQDLAHRLATPQVLSHLFGDDPDALERATHLTRGLGYEPFLPLMEPMPGLVETLEWLHARYRTALVTNRGQTIPTLLRHFDLARHFDLTVGLHDVARPKPAPDMLLMCLERFVVPPERPIYVGDSTGDLEAARAACVEFVAVGDATTGTRRIATFAELPSLLA